MGSPGMRDAYMKHLEKEFSGNNLQFVEAVAAYKDMAKKGAGDEELRVKAREIYADYIGLLFKSLTGQDLPAQAIIAGLTE